MFKHCLFLLLVFSFFIFRMSSVLALHFVEGLPRRNISKYEFDFHGTRYKIRTIIQYNEQREHFVTWIHQPDGEC